MVRRSSYYRGSEKHVQANPIPLQDLLAQVLARIAQAKAEGKTKLEYPWSLKRPNGATYFSTAEEKRQLTEALRAQGYTVTYFPDSAKTHPMVEAHTDVTWE